MQLTFIDDCCLELDFIYCMSFDNLQDNYTQIIDTESNFDLDTYSKTNHFLDIYEHKRRVITTGNIQ